MKLSHRDQLIVIGVVIVLLVVAAVFLLIMPQRRTISRMDGEIAAARTEIAAAKTLVERRQEAKRQAAVTEVELLRLANAIPESPEMPSLIIELQDTANDAGLEFVKIAPAADLSPLDGYSAVSVGLTVKGTWADIVHYLQRIQKLNRQLRVVDMVVTPVQETSSATAETTTEDTAPQLQADLTIQVYTMGGDTGSAVPGAPSTAQ